MSISPIHTSASPSARALRPVWTQRLASHFWIKLPAVSVAMGVFFFCYFAVLRHPLFPIVTMPVTAPDRWLGFQPAALIPYVSLWLYLPLLPALLVERRELLRCTLGSVALAALGLAVFLFWPTTIPHPDIDWSLHPAVAFLKTLDASGNACPSLHAAFAVFAAFGFARLLRRLDAPRSLRLANLLWAALIVYSTLATKQHVALDALAGSLLGAFIGALCFLPRPLLAAVIIVKLSAVALAFAGFPLSFAALCFFLPDAPLLYALFAPNAQGLCRVRTRFHTSRPEVWLTIDDGPDPDDTPRLLALLDRHDAKATFFLIGKRAARHPDLVAEIHRRGHEIGHHTHTHPLAAFWCAPPARVLRELDDAQIVFARSGLRPRRFRAPAGIKNLFLRRALADRDLSCIGWTVRSLDSIARSPAPVVTRVLRRLRPGAILLLHEGPDMHPGVRVEAASLLLAALSARGYRCVIPPPDQLR